MISELNVVPESWLTWIGGYDASGWLYAFVKSPREAVSDLLLDRCYFGPLNTIDRLQLLQKWLDYFGNSNQFAERLDAELADWVDRNWGNFDHEAQVLASAWSCLCGVVEFSSKLTADSQLKQSAAALQKRFNERQQFLGSFSTAPAADPLGAYLCVMAEFQREDRTLASFWHRMCELPDGVPFYHGKYAVLGLRRLRAADPSEDGTLRAEIVHGLLNLAKAFERLMKEGGLQEHIAKIAFKSVAAETAAAFPGSPRWIEHAWPAIEDLPERIKQWLRESVPALANTQNRKPSFRRLSGSVREDPTWTRRARELASALQRGDLLVLPRVRRLLDEERRFAELTGSRFHIVRSLRSFAIRILRFNSEQAARWAEEALHWQPYDDYSWNTLRTVLLRQGKLKEALRVAWVAWKRFPQDDVAHNGLAEVLRACGRHEEAENVYRKTIDRFPNDPFSRGGLAAVLTSKRRYEEALLLYKQLIEMSPDNVVARHGLADTLRRLGRYKEAEEEYRRSISLGIYDSAMFTSLAVLVIRKGAAFRAEALQLVEQALTLDRRSEHALMLKQRLAPDKTVDLEELSKEWDNTTTERIFEVPGATTLSDVELFDHQQGIWADESEHGTSLAQETNIESAAPVANVEKTIDPANAAGEHDIEEGEPKRNQLIERKQPEHPLQRDVKLSDKGGRQPFEARVKGKKRSTSGDAVPRPDEVRPGSTSSPKDDVEQARRSQPNQPMTDTEERAPDVTRAGGDAPTRAAITSSDQFEQPQTEEVLSHKNAPGSESAPDSIENPANRTSSRPPLPRRKSSEIGPDRFVSSKRLEIGALIAEAYFYRAWAKEAEDTIAMKRLRKATELLSVALQLDPKNDRVLAEQAALASDIGDKSFAFGELTRLLGIYASSVPLMVLKARLDREKAISERRRLDEASLTDLCAVPVQIRNLERNELIPLFHFQKGLASLALLDGAVRRETAAKAFSNFRRVLANRANLERDERAHALDSRKKTALRFHEWLQTQTDRHFFSELSEPTMVLDNEIPLVEAALIRNSMHITEVEDIFSDRTVFNTIL